MQLEHSFTVPVGIDEAWGVLLDIERVAPCMPGAALDSVDGDDFTGTVKVKLGPIGLTYKGKASFVEKDATAHVAVIHAQGRDARGNGTAAAKVSARLSAEGDSTKVDVTTDLDITGKPAQFGRGVMADVGNKLIGQFADCLATQLSGGGAADAPTESLPAKSVAEKTPAKKAAAKKAPAKKAPARKVVAESPAAARPARQIPPREVEPIDLMQHAGPAVAKRLAPVVAGLLVLLIVLRLLRRSR